MAENSNQMMIMVAVIGMALVGVWLYMRNKNAGISYNIGPTLDQAVAAGQQQAISSFYPSLGNGQVFTGPNATGAVSIPQPGSLTQGIIMDNYNKPGIPIISGSTKDIDDPTKYTKQAAGLCQCNESKCCYWAPYYARTGLKTSVSKNERCASIQYGNVPAACDRAFADFENDATSHRAVTGAVHRAEAARGLAMHYATNPVAAFRARQLAASRFARAMR